MAVTPRTLRGTAPRPLTALASLLLAAGLLAGCSSADEPAATTSAPTSAESDAGAGTGAPDDAAVPDTTEDAGDEAREFSYEGRDGSTVLDLLLEADPSAEVTGEGENAFVTGIDGIAADPDREFWALYVNGDMATVGAGSFETKDGDEVTWKLETLTS